MTARQAFIDESKRGPYLIAMVTADTAEVAQIRRGLRSLLLPGQRAIHFKKEQPGRRRQLLATMVTLGATCRVYSCADGTAVTARRACLGAAASDLSNLGVRRLVVELADGDLAADRRTLSAVRRHAQPFFEYAHLRAPQEPLLWIADACAWAWSHGGIWRAAVSPMVVESRSTAL